MMFDFFDYNFSSLISIFAALMGVAYPLTLQAIQRIDEMYRSTKLAAYFQRQWFFRLFSGSLLVAIPMSIVAPFLLYYYSEHGQLVLVSIVHAIVVFALTLSVVILFKFILMTTHPMKCLKYLESKLDGSNPPLTEIFQILKYASDKDDDELYMEASSCIGAYLNNYRQVRDDDKSGEVWAMLMELLKQHSKRDNHFFSSGNLLVSYFFPITERIALTDEEFRYLWQTVDAVLQVDNESWIYSYWTFADQYYRFSLERCCGNDKVREQERFKEQHFMIGALLVYNGKYELLRKLMYFSNTLPQQFALVPSTFIHIHSQLYTLLSYKEKPLLLTQRYCMIGAPQDVSSDDFIARYAYRYAALLMIRLFTVNNWNYTYSNPMDLPSITKFDTIEELNAEIFRVNRLKDEISVWFEERNVIELTIGLKNVNEESVRKLCDDYIKQCEDQVVVLQSSTEVDPKKRNYIKSNLLKALKENPLTLPTSSDILEGYEHSIIDNFIQYQIDRGILKVGTCINAFNQPELIIKRMNESAYKAYNSVFLLRSSVRSIRIAYKDIERVLDTIGVGKDNVVLSLGVYLDNDEKFVEKENLRVYRGCEIYSIPSSQQSIVVMQKCDLPYVKKSALTNDHGLDMIDAEEFFYSNIDEIKELSDESSPFLCVDRGINLYTKERFRYIRLNIDFNSGFITDMAKIQEARDIAWPKNN